MNKKSLVYGTLEDDLDPYLTYLKSPTKEEQIGVISQSNTIHKVLDYILLMPALLAQLQRRQHQSDPNDLYIFFI